MNRVKNFHNLQITQDWPLAKDNPKNPVLERRRKRALDKLDVYRQEQDMFINLKGENKNLNILDIACGTGFRVLELANQGYSAIGLEIDPNLFHLVNNVAKNYELGKRLVCGDACQIPFGDETFDVVVSSSFFEHVYDVELAL